MDSGLSPVMDSDFSATMETSSSNTRDYDSSPTMDRLDTSNTMEHYSLSTSDYDSSSTIVDVPCTEAHKIWRNIGWDFYIFYNNWEPGSVHKQDHGSRFILDRTNIPPLSPHRSPPAAKPFRPSLRPDHL